MALFKNFQQFKDKAIDIAITQEDVCDPFATRINDATTFEEIMDIVMETHHNKRWAYEAGFFRARIMKRLHQVYLKKANLQVNTGGDSGWFIIDEGDHVLSGNARAFIHGDATVKLKDKAKAWAYQDAVIIAIDYSVVNAYNRVDATARDFAKIRNFGNGKIKGTDNSIIISEKKRDVIIRDSARFRKLPKDQKR